MKKVSRFLVLVLCVSLLIGIMAPAVASAKTIKGTSATLTCLTLNDSIRWLFGRTSTVTFKNTGSTSALKITATATNCSITSAKTVTLYDGQSYTFKIKTGFGKNGKVLFNMKELLQNNINYSLSESGTQMIIRTN